MRSSRILLADLAEAIAGIELTLTGVDFATYRESWSMQRAVERGLEIVSEATRGLDAAQKANYPEIPWREIAGLGNILRHEYHRIEPLIVWNITLSHLPALKSAVLEMMETEP